MRSGGNAGQIESEENKKRFPSQPLEIAIERRFSQIPATAATELK
jgi:hypothetical protein